MAIANERRSPPRTGRQGSPRRRARGRSDEWHVEQDALGWLGLSRPADGYAPSEILDVHSDWLGPIKLVWDGGGISQRVDLYLGARRWSDCDAALDEDAARQSEALIQSLHELGEDVFGGRPPPDGWRPPPARQMADWLSADGHAVATDRDGNLRLTLTRSGCDGQVRVDLPPGKCRFSMLLGRWHQLPGAVEAAMLSMVHDANAKIRLVRLCWVADNGQRRCEAQVDLTGLPWEDPAPQAVHALWQATTQTAVAGLDLALRWLGRELALLATPEYADLARFVPTQE